MVGDYGLKYGDWTLPIIPSVLPNALPIDNTVWLTALQIQVTEMQKKFDLLDDIMNRVKALENAQGVPPCEDPGKTACKDQSKTAWMEEVKTAWMEEVRLSLVNAQIALDKLDRSK